VRFLLSEVPLYWDARLASDGTEYSPVAGVLRAGVVCALPDVARGAKDASDDVGDGGACGHGDGGVDC
jgi:hypothetical protein